MRHYSYQAVDAAGREVQGTLSAGSAQEVAQALAGQGFRIRVIQEAKTAAASAAPPTRPAPATPIERRPSPPPAVRQVIHDPPAPVAPKLIRTRQATEKDLYFVFSQLAAMQKAGIPPARAFDEVASRTQRKDYADSLRAIGAKAVEGRSLAEVMALYPDLYPSHVVGATHAGEVGGFLPDAFNTIVAQVDSGRKFKRWFTWLGAVFLFCVLPLPFVYWFAKAATRTWVEQDKLGGGTSPSEGMAILGHQLMIELRSGAFLWQLAAVFVLWILAKWYCNNPRFRAFRHRAALYTPTVGQRAKHESLALFSWTLSKVSNAGIPPQTAWAVAAGAMPNLSMRKRMEEVGSKMTEGTKLSEALSASKAMPYELGAMVSTGELTGDVPGMLERASRSQMEMCDQADRAAKMRVGIWMVLVIILTSVMVVWIYSAFLQDLIRLVPSAD